MADKQDIFTGSRVEVAVTLNSDSETASFFDPSYATIPELAAFPQLAVSTDIRELETDDSEFTSRLSGEKQIQDTTLVVHEIPADPIQKILLDAADDKRLLRFRNYYIIDTAEKATNSQQGVYQIYDAYVTGVSRKGGASQATTLEFALAPTGAILAQGVSETGEVVRQGDYGVGAGVNGISGPRDTTGMFGNSWRSYAGSISDNPFGQDTTLIHSQPDPSSAWQITANTRGAPDIRIRNLQDTGNGISKSSWVRLITESNLPTPSDINAVNKNGDTMAGPLVVNQISSQVPQGTTGGSLTRKDYVDGEIGKQVSKTGDTMTGQLIINQNNTAIRLTNSGNIAYLQGGNLSSAENPALQRMYLTGYLGVNLTEFNVKIADYSQAKINGNPIYHAGNKPTPADLGAIGISDVISAGKY